MQKLLLLLIHLFCASMLFAQGSGISNPVAIGNFLDSNLPATTPDVNGSPMAPALLSQTGAFANLTTLEPSPGVIPYDLIEPFWSDGAAKNRWMAIPNDGSHNTAAEQIGFSIDGNWTIPIGGVLIKHFEIGGTRLETRFTVHGSNGVYYFLTYKWNAAQTDADLLSGALDETVLVNGIPQVWHYPSRAECESCHTPEGGFVLGPKTRHLNKNITYPISGTNANQLVTLSHLGIITENITDANSSSYMAVAAQDDISATLEHRALSYIDVNCSYCHQPAAINGAMFDARITTPLANQNIIYGPVLYDEGLSDPKVVIPQDIPRSMMHYRMNSLQNGIEMPPLGKNVIDADGVQLIADWINSLTPASSFPPESIFSATPVFGVSPMNVSFDASASTDNDGDPLTYAWDFGDGGTSTNIITSNTYNSPGSYLITLTVSDGTFTDVSTTTITVNESNPGGNTVSFTDETSLIPGNHFSGVAIAISDMNGDGRDDLIRLNSADNLNVQYQNAPGQTFTSDPIGQISSSNEWSICIADYDHNGYNDILSGGAYNNLTITENNAMTYVMNTLPNSNIFLQGSNFADINNDGWADIFACHDDAVSRAYENNQDGTFTYDPLLINTETTPSSDNSGNYASMWTDYDNDGDLDLYISKCRIGVNDPTDPRRINMLWQNDGNNNFTEVAAAANIKVSAQSWLSDFGDIDNDGDLDCFVVNHYEPSNIFLNNGNGTFTDVTATAGTINALDGNEGLGIQGLFRDFNNDGYVDIIYSGDSHFVFYNNGDGTFTEAPNPFNSNQIQSISVGDLNYDGFLDVYAGYANGFNSPSSTSDRLFMNDGNSNHFFNVQLEGSVSNYNGIGARVEAYGVWGMQMREVRSGEGYGIHNSFTQHFGLGQATSIDSIVVRWPSGNVQVVDDIVGVDQFLRICESSGTGNSCIDPTCFDGIQNQGETDIDCGGPNCNACISCFDGIQNQGETSIDCGGPNCVPCGTCSDGIQNGTETGIDCGGANCPVCPESCSTYEFIETGISIYPDPNNSNNGTHQILDNGATLFFTNNGWRAVELNYTVTANTVLEFDFNSPVEGEIHMVGFDNELNWTPDHYTTLYGTQNYGSTFSTPAYTGNGNYQHYTVQIGDFFTGTYQYLVLVADDDATGKGESYMSNIEIYEDLNDNQMCDGDQNCVGDYGGGSNPPLGSAPSNSGINGPFLDENADFEVSGAIQSDQVIGSMNNNIQVDYDAGDVIELLPGFEVRKGVEFDAFIDDENCNNGAGGNQ